MMDTLPERQEKSKHRPVTILWIDGERVECPPPKRRRQSRPKPKGRDLTRDFPPDGFVGFEFRDYMFGDADKVGQAFAVEREFGYKFKIKFCPVNMAYDIERIR